MADKIKLELPELKFTQINPVLGYTHSLIDAFQVLWQHESSASARYITCRKTAGLKFNNLSSEESSVFGTVSDKGILNLEEIDYILKKFQENVSSSDIKFQDIYDLKSIPYYVGGVWVFECEHGKCRFNKQVQMTKKEFDPLEEDPVAVKKRKFKLVDDKPSNGCPAQVKFIEMLVFTEYGLKKDEMIQSVMRQCITQDIKVHGISAGEYRIYVSLPDPSTHYNHTSDIVHNPRFEIKSEASETELTNPDNIYGPVSKLFRRQFDDLNGYVTTINDAMAIVKKFELLTAMKYITLRATRNFGHIDVHAKNHRLRRRDPSNPFGNKLNLDGDLHSILGFMYLGCQHGKGKQKGFKETALNDINVRETKKYDCPAAIAIKEIMVYVDYTVQDSQYKNKHLSNALRQAITNGTSNGERRFYISLPPVESHTCQNLGLKFRWKSLLENVENIVSGTEKEIVDPCAEDTLPAAKDKLTNVVNKLSKLANVLTSVEMVNDLQLKVHSSMKRMIDHMSSQYKKECAHKCQFCHKVFYQRYLLIKHMNIHTRDKKFQCRICGKRFLHQGTLHRHKAASHSAFRPHQCHICGAVYVRTDNLRLHMRNKHNKEMPKFCQKLASKINEPFRRLSKNASKLKKLSGPFQCGICNVEYVKRRNLEVHMQRYHNLDLDSLVIDSDQVTIITENDETIELSDENSNAVEILQLTESDNIENIVKNMNEEFILDEMIDKSVHYMCDICHALFDSVHKLDTHFIEVHNCEANVISENENIQNIVDETTVIDEDYVSVVNGGVSQAGEEQITCMSTDDPNENVPTILEIDCDGLGENPSLQNVEIISIDSATFNELQSSIKLSERGLKDNNGNAFIKLDGNTNFKFDGNSHIKSDRKIHDEKNVITLDHESDNGSNEIIVLDDIDENHSNYVLSEFPNSEYSLEETNSSRNSAERIGAINAPGRTSKYKNKNISNDFFNSSNNASNNRILSDKVFSNIITVSLDDLSQSPTSSSELEMSEDMSQNSGVTKPVGYSVHSKTVGERKFSKSSSPKFQHSNLSMNSPKHSADMSTNEILNSIVYADSSDQPQQSNIRSETVLSSEEIYKQLLKRLG